MFTEILTGNAITPEVWIAELNEEYLRQSFWMRWAGSGDSSIIQLREDLTKASGDAINTQIRSQLQGGVVTGRTKSTGNEGKIDFYNFRQTVDDDKISVKGENMPMTQQRAAFSIVQSMRSALVDKRRLRTDDRITNALSDTTLGRVRGRYLYGALDSNWNATHATALQAIDATDDKLKLVQIDIAKRKAQLISGNATAKIRPYKVMIGEKEGVQEWFVYAGHTLSMRDLTNDDPAWKNPMLLIPPVSNPNNPLFTGAWFKGGYNGVLIYEWEGILTGSSTIAYAHNLLLGAQAGIMAWAQYGKIEEELTNYKKDMGLEHHEINGINKVVYDRNTVDGTISNEDNAVVHHFTAAVAD